MLNSVIDKIYCINLEKRHDRWMDCVELFKRIDIEVQRVDAMEDLCEPWNALRITTISIFKDAIRNEYNNILILEDDIDCDPISFNEKFKESWLHLPVNWDMFYFSAAHQHWPIKLNEYLFKLRWSTAAHAICFNKKAFSIILDKLKTTKSQIDNIYSILQKTLNAYCCINPIAWQKESFSDIENKNVWYPYLKDIDFYEKYNRGEITIDGKEIQQ